MKTSKKAENLWEKMARIERMERGKICKMSGRTHYNHQTWQSGRNIVRYVPRNQVEDLQEAIDGYKQFMDLAQQYADEIIRLTRIERAKRSQPEKEPKSRRTD